MKSNRFHGSSTQPTVRVASALYFMEETEDRVGVLMKGSYLEQGSGLPWKTDSGMAWWESCGVSGSVSNVKSCVCVEPREERTQNI